MPGQQRSSRNFTCSACALLLAAVVISTAAAAAPDDVAFDSPYVVRGDDGTLQSWSVAQSGDRLTMQARPVRVGESVEIPAVGAVPSFRVKLQPPAKIMPDERKSSAGAPLFVVADTHGEYEILVALLQKHRVIDGSLDWSFGRGQLIFLGDIFDRGPNHTEILWLLYHLEMRARRSGGAVHLVLGNHESMVMRGDLRYLNPKYVRTAQALGVESYSELVGGRTLLGQWLRTKPVVLKVNGLLCLHGGISREVVDRNLSLKQLNSLARGVLTDAAMSDAEREQAQFVLGREGPQWYRGYFADQKDFPAATAEDVDLIRKHFGVGKILIGHTQVSTVTPLYDGKVIAVQVYPRRDQDGTAVMEALRIEKHRYLRARVDGASEPLEIE